MAAPSPFVGLKTILAQTIQEMKQEQHSNTISSKPRPPFPSLAAGHVPDPSSDPSHLSSLSPVAPSVPPSFHFRYLVSIVINGGPSEAASPWCSSVINGLSGLVRRALVPGDLICATFVTLGMYSICKVCDVGTIDSQGLRVLNTGQTVQTPVTVEQASMLSLAELLASPPLPHDHVECIVITCDPNDGMPISLARWVDVCPAVRVHFVHVPLASDTSPTASDRARDVFTTSPHYYYKCRDTTGLAVSSAVKSIRKCLVSFKEAQLEVRGEACQIASFYSV